MKEVEVWSWWYLGELFMVLSWVYYLGVPGNVLASEEEKRSLITSVGDDSFWGSRFRMLSNDMVLNMDEENRRLKYTDVNFVLTLVH